jgi:hypothetical protein
MLRAMGPVQGGIEAGAFPVALLSRAAFPSAAGKREGEPMMKELA